MIFLKEATMEGLYKDYKKYLPKIMNYLLAFLFGFFAAKGAFLSKYEPFGVCAVAGCERKHLTPVFIGSVLGYLFPSIGFVGFKYIAVTVAVFTIRYLLKGIEYIEKKPIILSSAVTTLLIIISFAVTINTGNEALYIVAEGAISFVATYFIFIASKIKFNETPGLYSVELIAFCFTLSFVLLGLFPLNIDGVSIGRIFAGVIILAASYIGGSGVGTVAGTIISLISFFGGFKYSFLIPVYTVGGLASGFFSSANKILSSAAYLSIVLIALLFSDSSNYMIILLIESLISIGIFLIIPKNVQIKLTNIFIGRAKMNNSNGVLNAICMRLRFAGSALKDISNTVDEVSVALGRINSPEFDSVLKTVENSCCKGCSLKNYCWETKRSETIEAVLGISSSLKRNDGDYTTLVSNNFISRCKNFDFFKNSVIQNYSDYMTKINAENRILEVREIINEHFDGISNMLYDLSNEFKYTQNFDMDASEKIVTALRSINIKVTECAATFDRYNRLSADIKVKCEKNDVLNKMDILKKLNRTFNREFDPPCIERNDSQAFISITEKTVFYSEIGVAQKSAHNNLMCGDSYEFFLDGKGHMIIILCDGMGTGGRAAVDSSMTVGLLSRLIKSGFGFDCSLKIVNSSMLFKSTDETLTTVDIVSVNLFTGEVELYKAGAAPSLVKKKGKCAKAVSTSLPAGILREIGFDKANIKIYKDDFILMMSDGVCAEGTEWISAFLEGFSGTAQELADIILSAAIKRRTDIHEDDMTVIALALKS